MPLDLIWVATMINELESLRAFPPGNATAATTTLAAGPQQIGAGSPQIGAGPQQSAPAATVASLTGKPAGHCSDISARPRAGGGGHGHNEDWPGPIRAYWYLASYTVRVRVRGRGRVSRRPAAPGQGQG